MNETSPTHLTRREFRLVSLGLAILPIIVIVLMLHLLQSQNALLPRPPVSTPIVIRGGSMTAFTERSSAPNGWKPKPPPYPATYCVDIIAPGAGFYAELHDNDANSTLLDSWTNPTGVYIHDHDISDPTLSTPSKTNGFAFILRQTDCGGGSANKSVTISTNVGSFYKLRLPAGPGNHHIDNLRFLDSSPACATDEDACERMAEVVVALNGVTQPPVSCLDGDCTVIIGTK